MKWTNPYHIWAPHHLWGSWDTDNVQFFKATSRLVLTNPPPPRSKIGHFCRLRKFLYLGDLAPLSICKLLIVYLLNSFVISNFFSGSSVITEFPQKNHTKLLCRVCYCDTLKGVLAKCTLSTHAPVDSWMSMYCLFELFRVQIIYQFFWYRYDVISFESIWFMNMYILWYEFF